MGLLNDYSDDLLKLIRNTAQNRNPNANPGAGDANDLPPWLPQPQQRLPLSFAGPGLTANVTASSPSQPGTTFARPSPTDASTASDLSWLSRDWSADPLRPQPPVPPAQNLTAQALRMKGVPEAGIAAAIGNPELMKRLIIQNFSTGSAGAPAGTGYAPYGSSAGGGSYGDSGQGVYPETRGLDATRARPDAPAWGRFTPGDPTGLSAGNVLPYHADANNRVQRNDPNAFFVGPRPGPDPSPSQGPPLIQPVGLECKGFPAGCQFGGNFGDAGRFHFDIGDLCRSCAIRYTGAENLPAGEQIKILRPFERK